MGGNSHCHFEGVILLQPERSADVAEGGIGVGDSAWDCAGP